MNTFVLDMVKNALKSIFELVIYYFCILFWKEIPEIFISVKTEILLICNITNLVILLIW